MKIDLARLEELADLMDDQDLVELEIADGEQRTAIERLSPVAAASPLEEAVPGGPESSGLTITAPRVGIFRRAVVVGDQVTAGGRVGEIQVMDVKYAVAAPADGMVEEIFIEDGLGVEYGQPLIRLTADKGRP